MMDRGGAFLDANVILRHVAGDHSEHSPRATAYIRQLIAGEVRVRLLDQAVFEAAFTLRSMYRATREEIADALLMLIELPNVDMTTAGALWRRAFQLFLDIRRLSLVDAFHVASMEREGIAEIVSFDKGFDRLPGIGRIEP